MTGYKREHYIENYKLTQDEFLLLPFEEELAYTKSMYGHILKELKNIGDKKVLNSYFPRIFDDFFHINGIQIKRYGSEYERTIFTRINNNHYKVLEYAEKELDLHRKFIALVKAMVFEKMIANSTREKELCNSKSLNLLKQITYYSIEGMDIPDVEKEKIIMGECLGIVEELFSDGEVLISSSVAKEYLKYLRQCGFLIEEQISNIKVYKKA